MSILTSIDMRHYRAVGMNDRKAPIMNTYDANFAAWIIAGIVNRTDVDERNLAHLRALKASRSPSPGIASRLAAAVAAIRPAAASADPDGSPA
jgi:hypothetical protein